MTLDNRLTPIWSALHKNLSNFPKWLRRSALKSYCTSEERTFSARCYLLVTLISRYIRDHAFHCDIWSIVLFAARSTYAYIIVVGSKLETVCHARSLSSFLALCHTRLFPLLCTIQAALENFCEVKGTCQPLKSVNLKLFYRYQVPVLFCSSCYSQTDFPALFTVFCCTVSFH